MRKPTVTKLMDKYSKFVGVRDELVGLNIRGEKPRKIAEFAEVIKELSRTEATKSFQMSREEFTKAYGPGQKGLTYVNSYLRKFGIPEPRVAISQDIVHMWSRKPVK